MRSVEVSQSDGQSERGVYLAGGGGGEPLLQGSLHFRRDTLRAFKASLATLLASASTRTKSGLDDSMMVSCCITLWIPEHRGGQLLRKW